MITRRDNNVHHFDEVRNDRYRCLSDHWGIVLAELIVHLDNCIVVSRSELHFVKNGKQGAHADSEGKNRKALSLGCKPLSIMHSDCRRCYVFIDFLRSKKITDLKNGLCRLQHQPVYATYTASRTVTSCIVHNFSKSSTTQSVYSGPPTRGRRSPTCHIDASSQT